MMLNSTLDFSLIGNVFNHVDLGLEGLLVPLLVVAVSAVMITRRPRHLMLLLLPLGISWRIVGLNIPLPALLVSFVAWVVTIVGPEAISTGFRSIGNQVIDTAQQSAYGQKRYEAHRLTEEMKEARYEGKYDIATSTLQHAQAVRAAERAYAVDERMYGAKQAAKLRDEKIRLLAEGSNTEQTLAQRYLAGKATANEVAALNAIRKAKEKNMKSRWAPIRETALPGRGIRAGARPTRERDNIYAPHSTSPERILAARQRRSPTLVGWEPSHSGETPKDTWSNWSPSSSRRDRNAASDTWSGWKPTSARAPSGLFNWKPSHTATITKRWNVTPTKSEWRQSGSLGTLGLGTKRDSVVDDIMWKLRNAGSPVSKQDMRILELIRKKQARGR